MNKVVRWSICVLGMLVLTACPIERLLTGNSAVSNPLLPPDQVAYVPRSAAGSFEFKTLLPVDVNLIVRKYKLEAGGKIPSSWTMLDPQAADVYVTVTDSQGARVYAGRVLPDGTLSTRLMLPAAPEDLTFTLASQGFAERSFTVKAISEYGEINRIVSMQPDAVQADGPQADVVALPDRDGDSVPDVYDAFPDDSESAFAFKVPFDGPLTIAFEDLFGSARAGDADYNDFIADYQITEYANGQENAIVQVDGTAKSVAKIAGYNHNFLIAIDSFTGGADLTIQYPTRTVTARVTSPAVIPLFLGTKDTVGQVVSFSLHFDESQSRETMDEPPYNPFLYVWNTGYDIHLIGEESLPGWKSFGRTFQDAEGFPWALLVPSTWKHPLEGQRIEVPYPRFTLWRQSFGIEHTDWYLHYYDPYVPTRYVHVAGYFEGASNDVAAVWKDELGASDAATLTKLYDTTNARANSVYVSETAVYVAGYYTNTKGNLSACYWKNGVMSLPLYSDEVGTNSARAASVFVSGADVYVAGYINEGANKAGYWKNGSWQPLSPTMTAEAKDIVVSGTDVYVAGYVVAGGRENSCYWKNGTKIDLYIDNWSMGYGIAVSGLDVYVAGYYLETAILKAGYWKNDLAGLVPLHETTEATAFDVVVSGTDVYAAGYYTNGSSKSVACYWKNGEVEDLYNDTVNRAQANGILVDGTDVYVAGYVNEGIKAACYWMNGVLTPLEASTSECYSLAIQD